MNGQIFISYRREDASYPAGRLYDNLHSRFPQNEIFMDVDSIKPGIDFIETIEERVSSCDVLVAVIGERWLSAADEEGRRRLDNPEDFVRVEVGTALKRGVRVIPALVEGALMPQASQLPEDLKPLARRNALSVSHDRFRADSERLIDSVGEVLEAARVELPARKPEGQKPRGRAAPPRSTRISGLAIASLVCSILFVYGTIPAIICGHLARKKIRQNSSLSGANVALAGLIIGYITIAIIVAAGLGSGHG
jgi:hypothetical protein